MKGDAGSYDEAKHDVTGLEMGHVELAADLLKARGIDVNATHLLTGEDNRIVHRVDDAKLCRLLRAQLIAQRP
jgi:hypothetical protein